MKTILAAAVVFASLFIIHDSAFGQGALTPPGPPGATMLTLSQVEPRTPISSLPLNITQPGSYYLTTNLTAGAIGGIVIFTNGVTVDLNGFTISSAASGTSGAGIYINPSGAALRNITILNGFIQSSVTNNGSGVYSGNGFNWGIYYNGTPANVRVSGVSVSGVLDHGIYLGTGTTLVEDCEVHTAGAYGIVASIVKSCTALDIGGGAISADQVADCRGESKVNGYGIYATTTVRDSYGWSTNGNIGIYSGGTAQNCYGYSYGANGIGVSAVTSAINCFGYNALGGTGVNTGGNAENCYGQNIDSGTGINGATLNNCYGISYTGAGVFAVNALNCLGFCNVGGAGSYGLYTATGENSYGYNGGSGYGFYASSTALNCVGSSTSGTGLSAFIANSCHANTISATHNVNSY
ncbi:MAG TPA: hypothetical protein VNV43_12625 [Candidatus Acidoferrales bacterium]|nr:hypothetical protein [Candidatus Acidoferrales bacterium]